uniref:methyl-accepting chemotaxis protein n=1 Tax=Candidatus Magnetaquicoccus inordinatus TaxID=2496818 RepID=UPI001D0DFCF2
IYAGVPVRLGQSLPFGSLVIVQNANQLRVDASRSLYFGLAITALFASVAVFIGILLARSIVKKIRSMVDVVATATGQVLSSANGIAAAVSDEVAIATEQSAAVTEITASMEELSATSNQINENAGSVLSVSTQTLEVAEQGRVAAMQVMRTMKQINDDNQKNISDVVELGRKSQEINRVMEIINGIADQTKLIAFNAAIEASSAGEAGARFGVVAVEIRRLADSVMESTREISDNLKEIQESVNRLVIASETGAKGIQSGSALTEETVGFLNDIFSGAQATNDAAKQISLSTQQQKTATTQIVFALKEIEMGSQQISVSIHTTHDTCTGLMELSKNLSEQVEHFKSI